MSWYSYNAKKNFSCIVEKEGKDYYGNRHGFPSAISWRCYGNVNGGFVARTHGLHSEKMKGKIDNTDIYRFMYLGLFGKWLE